MQLNFSSATADLTITPLTVPEPSTRLLLGSAVAIFLLVVRSAAVRSRFR